MLDSNPAHRLSSRDFEICSKRLLHSSSAPPSQNLLWKLPRSRGLIHSLFLGLNLNLTFVHDFRCVNSIVCRQRVEQHQAKFKNVLLQNSEREKLSELVIERDSAVLYLEECQVSFQHQLAQYDLLMPQFIAEIRRLNFERLNLCKFVEAL